MTNWPFTIRTDSSWSFTHLTQHSTARYQWRTSSCNVHSWRQDRKTFSASPYQPASDKKPPEMEEKYYYNCACYYKLKQQKSEPEWTIPKTKPNCIAFSFTCASDSAMYEHRRLKELARTEATFTPWSIRAWKQWCKRCLWKKICSKSFI